MNESEKLTRKLIDIAMTINISIDSLCDIAKIDIPKLTDKECKAIACNYPYSFNTIRSYFDENS